MVYLVNTIGSQPVMIRKAIAGAVDTGLHFSLLSKGENRVVYDSDVTAVSPSNRSYYRFMIALPQDTRSGEYRYELTSHGELVGVGIAVIGGYAQATREDDNSEGITIRQYGE